MEEDTAVEDMEEDRWQGATVGPAAAEWTRGMLVGAVWGAAATVLDQGGLAGQACMEPALAVECCRVQGGLVVTMEEATRPPTWQELLGEHISSLVSS